MPCEELADGMVLATMPRFSLERRLLMAKPGSAVTPALFLDRDGVIIEDRHHTSDPADVELCPGAWQLIHHASQAGWPVIVITNQSGIARGLLSWQQYEGVTDRMLELLSPEAPIAANMPVAGGPAAYRSAAAHIGPVVMLSEMRSPAVKVAA